MHGWSISAKSKSAEFFVGDVSTLPTSPPHFVNDDKQTILDGMPNWNSSFEPGWATFIDPENGT
jgi:hypothetical protein